MLQMFLYPSGLQHHDMSHLPIRFIWTMMMQYLRAEMIDIQDDVEAEDQMEMTSKERADADDSHPNTGDHLRVALECKHGWIYSILKGDCQNFYNNLIYCECVLCQNFYISFLFFSFYLCCYYSRSYRPLSICRNVT
ncbi:uncharacterized protein LOC131163978 [Malania oleifera]|uniref:uncharacterized protein LOC131163978 n=1 Tax=Malania oleifera TaxID=397392 RepID=UPI0025AE939E|nr:uncharacterized protein LOC131163978 [Malania oleifera]